jgi:hypothetical protein
VNGPDRPSSPGGADERGEAHRDGLPKEDSEKYQHEPADLLRGKRFTGNHRAEQNTCYRVE